MSAQCHKKRPLSRRDSRRSGGRPRVIMHTPESRTAVGKPNPYRSKRTRKLELIDQARRAGWRGRSYWSARKFERKIERQQETRNRLAHQDELRTLGGAR